MRPIDDNTLQALHGSRAGDKITAYVWYNGSLAYPNPLPISKYAFDFDITRQIQKLSLEIDDADGVLAPWLFEDPLGVGGSELEVRYDVGQAGSINIGRYRIAQNTPDERWRHYIIDQAGVVHPGSALPAGKQIQYISGGASISVTAYDRGLNAKRARLIAPESPPIGATNTIIGEITRLMRDICPVVTAAGVTDRNVSNNIVYERDRLDAVQDLAKRIFCDYRFNGFGHMEIYPIAAQDPVATLEGGPEGVAVKVDRSMDIEGLYNVFVVDGSKDNGDGTSTPIRSVQVIDSGPLSAYGPMGWCPQFYSSTMIQNQDDADAYAFEMMQSQLSGLTLDLSVTCLPMPYLEQGDWVTVANPIVDGTTIPLVGKLKSLSFSGAGAPSTMTAVVQCSYYDVNRAMGGVSFA